jgi:hypothetical protein
MKYRWMLILPLGTALLAATATAQTSSPQQQKDGHSGGQQAGTSPEYGPDDQLQDPHQYLHHWELYQYYRSQNLDLDHDTYFQALQESPLFKGRGQGYRIGFRAGYEDGRSDLEDGSKWHFGYRFRYPDHYHLEFGDRDSYLKEYREGYEQGYKHAYVQQS